MFTGIVEEVGTVVEAGAGTLRIRAPFVLQDAKLGDSIAINGVDLTVARIDGDTFFAHSGIYIPFPGRFFHQYHFPCIDHYRGGNCGG